MSQQRLRGYQVLDGTISRNDLNIAEIGKAVIRKAIAGTFINLGYTGADVGTGDVTINVDFGTQTANRFLASPDGVSGAVSFRALTANDIPTLTLEKLSDAWIKRSVRVATTANITLSGTQTIDGVAVVAGDRVLVKNQSTASQNGIYVVAAGAWTRATDSDTASKIAGGTVNVDSGTTNGSQMWTNSFKTTDTLGTTVMNWARVVDTTYTIPVTQGGTGATTLTGVVIGNGTSAITALTGTANTLVKFSGNTIANSTITDTGSLVTVASSTRINGNISMDIASNSNVNIYINRPMSASGNQTYSILHTGIIQSDVTTNAWYNRTLSSTVAATFTLANLTHYSAGQSTFGAGSVVTVQSGFVAEATLIGGSSNYGFRGQIPSGTNRWNLYMDGTALNYLAGRLGIGIATLSASNLAVTLNITGGTGANGIYQFGTVQSDVTAVANGFANQLNTAAGSYTISAYNHFNAQGGGTIGASSVVTTQSGFLASSNLTQATNNYGFRGQLSLAAGRYNLYMDGTADNYLNGTTLFGTTTTDGSSRAIFNGTISATKIINNGAGVFTAFTADGQSQIYTTATAGLVLGGRGSTLDFVILNRDGNQVITVPTGTHTWNAFGDIVTNSTTASTSTTTGAIVSAGGLGVAGAAFIGGDLTAANIIRSGGTASQFLKADGSIDSSTYITAAQTYFIGTTSNALNRASAAQTLTGVSIDGNAATATALANARTINGVSFNGSANIAVLTTYDTNYRRIAYPGGGELVGTASSVAGAIAITLPVGVTNTMVRMTIKIYEYTSNEAFEINVGGYNYTGGTWANSPFAYIVGNPNTDRRFTIRLGYNSTTAKFIVYIGELASTWTYPQIYVTEVLCGHSGQSFYWTTGWSIGFEATAFQNVTATITNPQVGYATSTNTANAVVLRDGSGNFSSGAITMNNNSFLRGLNTSAAAIALIGMGADNTIYVGDTGVASTVRVGNSGGNLQIATSGAATFSSTLNVTGVLTGSAGRFTGTTTTETGLDTGLTKLFVDASGIGGAGLTVIADSVGRGIRVASTTSGGVIGAFDSTTTVNFGSNSSHNVTLRTAGVTALTLNTSQEATFASSVTATRGVFTSGMTAWDPSVPGGNQGTIHLGSSSGAAGTGAAITFAASGTAPAQAGIYILSSGAYGTRMYIATTDSFATGSRTAISISEAGLVNFVRTRPTALGNIILDAGNYNSYALPLSGGIVSGTITIANTNPVFVLRDTDNSGTGAGQIGYISFQDSTSTERAWIGYGSTGSTTFTISNSRGNIGLTSKLVASSSALDEFGGAFEIRETGNVLDTQSAWGYSPAISFHWGNRFVKRFGLRSDGQLAIDDEVLVRNSGTWSINVTGTSGKLVSTSIANVSTGRTAGTLEYYDVADATGAPTTGWCSYISARHSNPSNENGFQIAYGFGSENFYFRGWDGTNPLSWRTILHSSNVGAYALPIVGGTMSGHINMGVWNLNNAGTVQGQYAEFSNPSGGASGYFQANGNATYGLQALGASGASRTIFIAGQTGFSNGFTVRYNHTAPAAMQYEMRDGSLTVSSGNINVGSGGSIVLSGGDIFFNNDAGYGLLSANGGRALVITNSVVTTPRNFGIGVGSPVKKLEVDSGSQDSHFALTGTAPGIQLSNVISSPTQFASIGLATTTNNYVTGSAQGDLVIVNRSTVTSKAIIFGIGTTNEVARFATSGRFLLGTPTDDTVNRLQVNGSVKATKFTESSDRRIKTPILENYINLDISNLKAHLYEKNGQTELGYYAQEVQEFLPHAVSAGADGMLSVTYREVLVAKMTSVESRTEQLERKVKELEKEITNLKMQNGLWHGEI